MTLEITTKCPECGCDRHIRTDELGEGYRVCFNCYQEWWTNVDYKEQQFKYIVEALTIEGFARVGELEIFTKVHGDHKIVVDLTAGKSIYFKSGKDKITMDDEAKTLNRIFNVVLDAEDGKMPTKTQADIVVNSNAKDEPTQTADIVEPKIVEPELEPLKPSVINVDAREVVEPTPAPNVPQTAPVLPPQPYKPQGTIIHGFVPQLKEIGKIKIGRKGETRQGKSGEYRLPEKFDHFEVVTLIKDEHNNFIPDKIMGSLDSDPKELDIILLYNDPTLNFYTRYNEYKGGKRQCSGDGKIATDINDVKLSCNPETCPKFISKRCKPNGVLSVILTKSPRLGGVYKFRTTGWNSIRSILSSMMFLQTATGGTLAGIPLKLTLTPQQAQPKNSPTSHTIYVVNIEFAGTMEQLLNETIKTIQTRHAMQADIQRLESTARLALDAPESEEEIEDIQAEFYPDGGAT